MKRVLLALLLITSCRKLDSEIEQPSVSLSAPLVNRTVGTENPRVYTCSVVLVVEAGQTDAAAFVELLTLRREIEVEGGVSSVTDAATRRFPTRRLSSGMAVTGTDDFSATFPFRARFSYTLRYRDMALRVDSTTATAQCG